MAHIRPQSDDEWLWDGIAALNRLRNELVHQLPAQKFQELRQQFIDLIEASPELPELEPPPDIHERLHGAIFSLHEGMSHRVDL